MLRLSSSFRFWYSKRSSFQSILKRTFGLQLPDISFISMIVLKWAWSQTLKEQICVMICSNQLGQSTFHFGSLPDVSWFGRFLLSVGSLLVPPVESLAVQLVRGVRHPAVLHPVTPGLDIWGSISFYWQARKQCKGQGKGTSEGQRQCALRHFSAVFVVNLWWLTNWRPRPCHLCNFTVFHCLSCS